MNRNDYMDKLSDRLEDIELRSLTARKIAEFLDTSPMAFYKHFENKQDFLAALAERGFQKLTKDLLAKMPKKPAPIKKKDIKKAIKIYFDFAIENPNLYRLMFSDFIPNIRDFEEMSETADTLMDAFIDIFKRSQYIESSNKVRGLSVHAMAIYIWTSVHGIVMSTLDGRVETWRFSFSINNFANYILRDFPE